MSRNPVGIVVSGVQNGRRPPGNHFSPNTLKWFCMRRICAIVRGRSYWVRSQGRD